MSGGSRRSTQTQNSTQNTSQTQSLNPWSQDQWQDQWNRVQDMAGQPSFTPYTGRTLADFGTHRSAYTNPYDQDVLNSSLADIENYRQQMHAGTRDRMLQSGAYGGSRHGVADSLTNEAALREAGRVSADLRQRGFNDAYGRYAADIDVEHQDFLRQQQDYWQRMQTQMGLLGSIPMLTNSTGTGSSSGTSTSVERSNPGALGVLGGLASVGSMFIPGMQSVGMAGGGLGGLFSQAFRRPTDAFGYPMR